MERPIYVIISPVRNEEAFIEKTIHSLISQTIQPTEWIIVNDGSTDRTRDIIESYLNQHEWIKLIDRDDRGFRQRGVGVVQAFYFGYNRIQNRNFQFVSKLDGDISFQSDYFQTLFERFNNNPHLGIASGVDYSTQNKLFSMTWKESSTYYPLGPLKTYRRECFEAIGGLKEMLDWDTLDVLKAQMVGWETRCYKDLYVNHRRIMGSLEKGLDKEIRWGEAKYSLGYHPLYIIASGLMRMGFRPVFIGGLGIIYGYFKSLLLRKKRIDDKQLIKFIRKQQLRRLFGLKQA